jgi:hypothetical protein
MNEGNPKEANGFLPWWEVYADVGGAVEDS